MMCRVKEHAIPQKKYPLRLGGEGHLFQECLALLVLGLPEDCLGLLVLHKRKPLWQKNRLLLSFCFT
jgi:hypothetical protein